MSLQPLLSGDASLIEDLRKWTVQALVSGFSKGSVARSHEEDICQQVLAAALRRARKEAEGTVEPLENLKSWVIRVTRNEAYKVWHRQGGDDAPMSLQPELHATAAPETPEGMIDRLAIRKAMLLLDGKCRDLIMQALVLRRSRQEIAEEQGRSEGAVRTALARCRQTLLGFFLPEESS